MKIRGRSINHHLLSRTRKSKVIPGILDLTGNELKNKKWVFILGCYNSGTTLLNQILAEHPQISGLPDEGVMLTSHLVKPEDFGWRRMWWKCETEMENSDININKSSTSIKRQWSHFYENKEFLVEKSISNTCRIPFLANNFQPAFFIHLVRNGYAVAEGIRRKAELMQDNPYYGEKNYPISLCAKQWTESLRKVEGEKGKLNNFLEITYENFTANPEKEIKTVTDFLGIEPFENNFFKQSFSIHGKTNEISNMNSRSFKKLSEDDIRSINEVAGNYLKKYGYPLL